MGRGEMGVVKGERGEERMIPSTAISGSATASICRID